MLIAVLDILGGNTIMSVVMGPYHYILQMMYLTIITGYMCVAIFINVQFIGCRTIGGIVHEAFCGIGQVESQMMI